MPTPRRTTPRRVGFSFGNPPREGAPRIALGNTPQEPAGWRQPVRLPRRHERWRKKLGRRHRGGSGSHCSTGGPAAELTSFSIRNRLPPGWPREGQSRKRLLRCPQTASGFWVGQTEKLLPWSHNRCEGQNRTVGATDSHACPGRNRGQWLGGARKRGQSGVRFPESLRGKRPVCSRVR